MADEGPRIVRPIPRRPFDMDLTTPTPPEEENAELSKQSDRISRANSPNNGLLGADMASDEASLAKSSSYANLTSSTLFGIFSRAPLTHDKIFGDRLEGDTPWGTGAQTPINRPTIDNDTYELMKDRSHVHRRRSSFRPDKPAIPAPNITSSPVALAWRVALLCLLGVGYGTLVTRFHEDSHLAALSEGIIRPGFHWDYLAFWGVSGVALGTLLPWFDKVWEKKFGEDEDEAVVVEKDAASANTSSLLTDWALVMRAIGAFVGIVFAIRKLAWASTLQISMALALVNPLLWWLIDRSTPGFVLSTAVGLSGSFFLLCVNPDMMPAPSVLSSFRGNTTVGNDTADPFVLGGAVRQETVETGVWMLTLLFCSCVCFGNIGRRLAWGQPTMAKGRWADVQ